MQQKKFKTIKQMVVDGDLPTIGQGYKLVREAHKNGFAGCFLRLNGRIMVDQEKYYTQLYKINGITPEEVA